MRRPAATSNIAKLGFLLSLILIGAMAACIFAPGFAALLVWALQRGRGSIFDPFRTLSNLALLTPCRERDFLEPLGL